MTVQGAENGAEAFFVALGKAGMGEKRHISSIPGWMWQNIRCTVII